MSRSQPVRVAVAGGGPAGLIAALDAARAGHDVELIERGPRVGGMSASFDVAGQRVDFGSHRLHPSTSPELLRELRHLLGTDLQVRQRNGRIRLRGSWISFPLRTVDLARRLPPSFALGALSDSVRAPFRSPDSDTFAGVVRAGLGPTVFDEFYGPYAKKLWGIDGTEIDSAMAERRVSAGSPLAIARRLMRARRSSGRVFLYPRGGYGQIAERLAEAAVDAGAVVRCDTELESVDARTDGVTLGLSGTRDVEADVLLSTVPVGSLAELTTPAVPRETIDATHDLEYRGMVFVYLVCDQPQFTEFDAHYFPGLDTPIARLSEPKNYRDGPDPADRTVLCAEIACTKGDEIWTATDDDLGAMVADSLEQQGLPRPRHVATETRRLAHVYPVYRVGFESSLAEIERWANTLDRVLTLGRQGLFVPDNLHHTLQMGRDAVAAVTAHGTIDRGRWISAREQFRSHVVED